MYGIAPTGPRAGLLPALFLLLLLPLAGQAQEKRPLDHDDYDRWTRIQQDGLSPDGRWFHYRLVPGEGEPTLHLRERDGTGEFAFERARAPNFTRDGRFFVFIIAPSEEAREEARGARNTPQPVDSLGILDLSTGELETLPRLRAVTVPGESDAWILIHRTAPRDGEEDEPADPDAADPAGDPDEEEDARPRRNKPTGTTLHYRNLATGEEHLYPRVTNYTAHESGTRFVFTASSEDGRADGVFLVRAGTAAAHPVLAGEGAYAQVTVDTDMERLAFLTNRDSWDEDEPIQALYYAELDGSSAARLIATRGSDGLPATWEVSTNGSLNFSHDGARLFFGIAPPAEPDPDEEDEMLANVEVDIWSWHDGFLQTQQLQQVAQERRRTYEVIHHLADGRTLQLETPDLLSVTVGNRRTSNLALGVDDQPYRPRVSWDSRYTDIYLIDVRSGARELIIEDMRGSASFSPEARFLSWWDGDARAWMFMDIETRRTVNGSAAIPFPVYNELNDTPAPPGSYGIAGWTEGDGHVVIYDAHDIWLVDPRGAAEPRNLTLGYGRSNDLRLRFSRTDWEDRHVPMNEEVLLTAFHLTTKADGFYRTRLDQGRAPQRLVLEDVSFGGLRTASDADVVLFTKSTFSTFPDLWTADADFGGQRQLTRANPQQDEFLWGSAELVSWTSADGERLQGLLYKPENFDPSQEWPMMVYFYERSSNGLHNYTIPGPGTSINRSFYVSRGYLLFIPDIPYKEGYPGESAMNAVIPGIVSLVDEGWVDPARIGVQGHSWGGYQISYMVTRTNLFAAAEAGAPVVNMTSAYGGIRWESGRVRQMQYEQGQSRIGATLWEAQHRYIENSPLFTAYKVETPLLILHNDQDGAVPWEEGIQFFVALRRLDKPVWLVNYNGQGHGVSGSFRQKDWAIRMQQFFDHYLQDAPPPVWMVQGVPAIQKGRTLGLDLVEPQRATDDGNGATNSAAGGGR